MIDGHWVIFFRAKSGHCEVIDGVFLSPLKMKRRAFDGHLMTTAVMKDGLLSSI